MKSFKSIFAAFVATAAIAVVPAANAAPTLHFAASGSSAMFQQFAISVVNDIAPTVGGVAGTIHHFTIKGSCGDSLLAGLPCVGIKDTRNNAIPVETATYWVAWVCADNPCTGADATDVWFYDQVDSTVGVRTYLAGAQSWVAGNTQTGGDAAGNLINAKLFAYGDPTGACGGGNLTCDAASIPADVYAAINKAVLNTGMTDIRPEDAQFATKRANSTSTLSPWTGLGYGGGPNTLIGASIQSSFSSTFATPVAFGLPGSNDPFTNNPVPNTIKVFPVGEEPILFIANRSNANGLGYAVGGVPFYNNVVDNASTSPASYAPSPIGQLFGGVTCSGSSPAFGLGGAVPPAGDFAVNPILREALSGTMNTTEFSSFRTFGGNLHNVGGSEVSNSNVQVSTSQEANLVTTAGNAPVNPLGGGPAANPPGTPCVMFGGSGLGSRYRAVGTGEEVGKPGGTGVGLKADSIGYTFFSFANVSNLGNSPNYGYLTLDGVDPIFANYAGGDPGEPGNGKLPTCSVLNNGGPGGCEKGDVWTAGNYFPHLQDGTYRAWSLLRAICDTAAAHCLKSSDAAGTEAIIAAAQDDIHNSSASSVADFLPFSDDGSFGPTGTNFGDARFIRSHYAFNSAIGGGSDKYPFTHTTPSFSILPAGLNADQANGVGGDPEAGGDAGGCIVNAFTASGVPTTQIFTPTLELVNANGGTKTKIFYTPLGANALVGVCGNAAANSCTESFTSQCGAASSCNPPASGMSVAVTGFTGTASADNGVFQVTRIVTDGSIKVRLVPTNSGVSPSSYSGVTGSSNTGCSQ